MSWNKDLDPTREDIFQMDDKRCPIMGPRQSWRTFQKVFEKSSNFNEFVEERIEERIEKQSGVSQDLKLEARQFGRRVSCLPSRSLRSPCVNALIKYY